MLCECGCGQRTAIAPANDARRGHVKGEAFRFIHGHQDGTPRSVTQAPWATMIVDFLLKEKRGGETSFDAAWRRAVKAHPPRGRDLGEAVPKLFAVDGSDALSQDVSVVEFTEFACGQAWHNYVGSEPGQGKALCRFHPALLVAMSDSSEPAARTRTAA